MALPGGAAPGAAGTPFRADIEGLRAIAVSLVVLSHVGLAAFGGGYIGVDVFFVISGFLITTLLVKELASSGSISVAGFYARRATRLLPAAALVLIVTIVASWLWLPATQFGSVSMDGLFTTFYGINWRLAAQGVDYFTADAAPSPMQHFWSLAVEEQFYLVWPLLLLVVSRLWARRGTDSRKPIVIALLVIVVASLTASIYQTALLPPIAYFGSHTRAWELAIGALVATVGGALARTPKVLAAVMSWTGLGVILISALVFDDSTAFPGYAAALPVLGTAAVIACGTAPVRAGASLLLRLWPLQQIGKLSYAWYLWHWPVLTIGPPALGLKPSLGLNVALAAGSLALAAASYRVVENPVRTLVWIKTRARRGLAVGLSLSASTAAVALIAGMLPVSLSTGEQAVDTAAALNAISPDEQKIIDLMAASSRGEHPLPDNLTPALTDAKFDQPAVKAAGCHVEYLPVEAPQCVYGDENGKKTVYLIGDSHMAQWFPAFYLIAKQRGWRLISLTKNICQVPSVRIYNLALKRPYDECVEFRNHVIQRIRADRPAMVIMSSAGKDGGPLTDGEGNQIPKSAVDYDQLWLEGWQTTFDQIKNQGTKLVMMQDTPWPEGNSPACATQHRENVNACAVTSEKGIQLPRRRELVAAAARSQGITVIDPIPWMCTDTCPIIVGNILVYMDNSHISTAWATLLAPIIEARLPAI